MSPVPADLWKFWLVLKYQPRNLPRKMLEYAAIHSRLPLRKRMGDEYEERIDIEELVANREFYTGDRILFPYHALIETSTKCNIECIMCARLDDPQPVGDLPYEIFRRCSETLLPHLKRVALTGHGEAFLNKKFPEMLMETRKHNLCMAITTNATLIDESMADLLVRVGLDVMAVSIDAASPALFEKIRKRASFEKVLEGIDYINYYKKKYRREVPELDVLTVGMKMNIHEFPDVVRMAADRLKARSVTLNPLAEYSSVAGNSLSHHPELARKFVPEAIEVAKEKGIRLTVSPVIESLLQSGPAEPSVDDPTPPQDDIHREVYLMCDDPWKFTFVTRTGKVCPCCASARVMGDITSQDFRDIWYGEEYTKFRTKFLSGEPYPECLNCTIRTKYYR